MLLFSYVQAEENTCYNNDKCGLDFGKTNFGDSIKLSLQTR